MPLSVRKCQCNDFSGLKADKHAIFVGRGVGTNALGAINLVNPFVLVVNALNLLISVGGVVICAVHMGKGDYERANVVFRHGIIKDGVTVICVTVCGECSNAKE